MKRIVALFFLALTIVVNAQHHESDYIPESDPLVLEKLEQWQGLKFGLLMHWGPYSQWGIVESWSICAEDEGWCKRSQEDYIAYKAEYEKLPETFNPVHFAPEKWAQAAKAAGMRYVVFTTKHHDGFCMFDSKYSDYKITGEQVPFHDHPKGNIAKEIFEAFREEGLWTGAYFSKPDWHHDDYWWPNFATPDRNVNYDPAVYPEKWESFVQFTHNQILELMTDYGAMDILWLDGGWVQKLSDEEIADYYQKALAKSETGFLKRGYVNQDIRMDELVEKCRAHQPGLIVVDRAVEGKNQNYITPENRVPDETLPYPWESCIISGGGWSFTPNARYMSGKEAIHLLVDIVAKGGNLLLNIAPGPDGSWQEGAYNLLKEYADWMAVNSESIYETRPYHPYKEGQLCFSQDKKGNVFITILADESGKMPESIATRAVNPKEVKEAKMLGSNSKLKCIKKGDNIEIKIPDGLRQSPPTDHAWVIKIEMQ